MKIKLDYLGIAVFSFFIGSQITEAVLLVPYWKSISADQFYMYYEEFGPLIGRFYTFLTVLAAFIPLILVGFCLIKRSNALLYASISATFTVLVVVTFYIYFKNTNQLFYLKKLSSSDLGQELITWGHWHWGRIVLEFLSLIFLVLALLKLEKGKEAF